MALDRISRLVLFCLAAVAPIANDAAAQYQAGDCPPSGYDRQQLQEIKTNGFEPGNGVSDDEFALALAACLASPDPVLRDGMAYEGLASLLRGGRISDQGKRDLLGSLSAGLGADVADGAGFMKPFVALGLAEVARTDRVAPWLTTDERLALVTLGADYLAAITDYRGYDETEGWRHGVAHTADLLMQLALNENIDVGAHRIMLAAIASQVDPAGHFYIYGEAERLVRPVLYIAARATIDEAEWTKWLAGVAAPDPLAAWSDAWSSNAGLAKRHNTSAFFSTLYLNASLSQNEGIKALLPGTIEAIRTLP